MTTARKPLISEVLFLVALLFMLISAFTGRPHGPKWIYFLPFVAFVLGVVLNDGVRKSFQQLA